MTKKLLTGMLVLGLLGITPFSTAAPRKTIRKSYAVEALPFPFAQGIRNGTWGCLAGEEGLQKVSRPFKAPWSGRLTATIDEFTGEWDLYLTDHRGSIMTSSNGGISDLQLGAQNTLTFDLAAGQKVNLVACNYAGGHTARVSYEFEYLKKAPPPQIKKKVEHTERGEYMTPAVATAHPAHLWFYCQYDVVQCSQVWSTLPSDRYVTVDIEDQSGKRVPAEVYQIADDGNGYRADVFCDTTEKPIELINDAEWVGVHVLLGPCPDGTPAAATGGEITITFSSHKT
jgi:hypothetical protein